jgi:ABC-type bacteriocin/lantibiotic exporter with double-glycine peptidase domain
MGYSYSGVNCVTKDYHFLGAIVIGFIVLFYILTKILSTYLLHQQQQKPATHADPERQLLLNTTKLDSQSIKEHLVSSNLTLDGVELVVGNAILLKNVNLHMKSGELTAVIGIYTYLHNLLKLI